MNQKTTLTKLPITKLTAGQTVAAGYIRRRNGFNDGFDELDTNRFDFFKVGELKFENLKVLKTYFGVKTLSELEFEVDRLDRGSVYAEFYSIDGDYAWAAYLWKGGFKVGSSADRLVVAV